MRRSIPLSIFLLCLVIAGSAWALQGGPDAAGYRFIDSNEPGGPAFTFNDISGTGTPLPGLDDDAVSGFIPIGFTFNHYGNNYTQLRVSSNGFVTFNNDGNPACCSGQILPYAGSPSNIIAAEWDDLYPGDTVVRYQTVGSAPSRQFIVQFTNSPFCCVTAAANTWQIVLYEGTNEIQVRYLSIVARAGRVTAGIDNISGTVGLNYPIVSATNLLVRYVTTLISGTIRESKYGTGTGGAPIPGVTVNLTGATTATTTTDANGFYSFAAVQNGSHTVTPTMPGWAFGPTNRTVISGQNGSGQDFIGTASGTTYSISGSVRTAANPFGASQPMAGVPINVTKLIPTANGTTSVVAVAGVITGADGRYSAPGLTPGNYTVSPSLGGFSFTPQSRSATITSSHITGQDFTGAPAEVTYSISGTVSLPGGAGISGVTVALSGSATGTTTTDANGNYTFTGLANGNYTVTPNAGGYTFTPTNRAVTVSGANVTGQNFTGNAFAVTYSISGVVTTSTGFGSAPVAGVTVTLSGSTNAVTTTDANGRYSFTGLSNGAYTVSPSQAGFCFSPVNRAVTINNANMPGQNFMRAGCS